jgi:antitoxin HigA-1
MSAGALAKACGLPRKRIERIASERTGIAAIPRFGSPRRSVQRHSFGSICRMTMIFRSRSGDLGKILDRIETVNKPKAA